jgi:hypothetical protein
MQMSLCPIRLCKETLPCADAGLLSCLLLLPEIVFCHLGCALQCFVNVLVTAMAMQVFSSLDEIQDVGDRPRKCCVLLVCSPSAVIS